MSICFARYLVCKHLAMQNIQIMERVISNHKNKCKAASVTVAAKMINMGNSMEPKKADREVGEA